MKTNSIHKLTTLLMVKGKKHQSEKLLLKSFKKLQKNSNKQIYEVYQTAVKNLIPILKIDLLKNKKQRKKDRIIRKRPRLLLNSKSRLTTAIKYIMSVIRNRNSTNICNKLAHEILHSSQQKGDSFNAKVENQKQAFLHRHTLLRFFRWKI